MKLNKFVILLGVVVVAGLAFIMSSEKASEKVTGVADDKKVRLDLSTLQHLEIMAGRMRMRLAGRM